MLINRLNCKIVSSRRQYIVLLLFVVNIYALNAQEKIRVLDNGTRSPISKASIYTNNTGTTTDSLGVFNLKSLGILTDRDTVSFSSVGYEDKKIAYPELMKSESVYLIPKIEQIAEVTIVSSLPKLAQRIAHTELASMPEGVFSFGFTTDGDKLYVIGGDASEKNEYKQAFRWEDNSGKMQVYNIEKDSWEIAGTKFLERAYHNMHYYNGKIYVLGGKRLAKNPNLEYLRNEIEVYDIAKDTIVVSGTNPHQAVNFASALYDDNIIVLGGSIKENRNGMKEMLSTAHLFNLKTGYWYELDSIPYAKETQGLIADGKMYLIGGFRNYSLKYFDSYNLETGEYKTEGEMPYAMQNPVVAYNDGMIYIYLPARLLTYNISTRKMNTYLTDIFVSRPKMLFVNNKLYIAGGYEVLNGWNTPSEELYCIDTDIINKTEVYTKTQF